MRGAMETGGMLHLVFDIDMTLLLSVECTFDKDTGEANCDENIQPKASSPRRRRVRPKLTDTVHFDLPAFSLRANIRPGAIEMLREIWKQPNLTTSIWSAGEPAYVHAVARELEKRSGGKFHIVWARDQCEKTSRDNYYKPLTKMANSPEGRALGMHPDASNVILIDDLKLNSKKNPGKVFLIAEYNRVNQFDYGLLQFAYMLFQELGIIPPSPPREEESEDDDE